MRISDWSSDVCSTDLVEQFVAHAAVEALDVAVLHWSSRSDVVPLHADLPAPCQHGITGELRAVVADDHAGLATPGDQQIGSASCRERVCRYVEISGVAESLKKKTRKHNDKENT